MRRSTASLMNRLDALRGAYGGGAADRKLVLLAALRHRVLVGPEDVRRLHEILCFWRAYPDSRRLLVEVERQLRAFSARAEVRRLRDDLENSGVAGADIVYPFNLWTAVWLAERWPDLLAIEWDRLISEERLARLLFVLALPAEAPGLDEPPVPVRSWARRLAAAGSDAAFVVRRVASLPAPEDVRARLFEDLDVPIRLRAGRAAPARTLARFTPRRIVWQREPLRATRPDLVAEALRPPLGVHVVPPRHAERLVDLAHEAMVTRERDLDAFAWADVRDVRLVDCGEGLHFACIGVRPEKRFLLESVYGFLTLKNGVPIGYALASGLFESAEVAYNVFATFRGGEAAHVYGRFLAVVRALFRADTFEVPPYQLGDGNQEGLESGAWWFYYKLGLRPWSSEVQPLVAREAGRVARRRDYRTRPGVLKQLVRYPLFLSLGQPRRDVLGWRRFDGVGLAVSDFVSARFGYDRTRAAAVLADEAGALLGVRNWRRLRGGKRVAWLQWSPLVGVLPGVESWPAGDRRALARVILAKGGRRESAFVPLFDAHARLRAAVLQLAAEHAPSGQPV